MAITVKVRNHKQIIVPIRFGRAGTGPTAIDAPEVDDRGFAMGDRPETWAHSDETRGAMVSIAEGDSIRIKVLREDVDGSAPLFVTSTNAAVVTVLGRANLGPDDTFTIRAVKDFKSSRSTNFKVALQVHLGSFGGPVLGEMEPHVFQLHRMRVVAHLVTINGEIAGINGTNRNADGVKLLFDKSNEIWRAAGIQFDYDRGDTIRRLIPPLNAFTDRIDGFRNDGAVDTELSKDETIKVLNLNSDENAINVYFVPAILPFGVIGTTQSRNFQNGIGVLVSDLGSEKTLAHELGHFLDIDLHADEDTKRRHIRDDIWSERRLMWSNDHLSLNQADETGQLTAERQPDYRLDVGYGPREHGTLIDVKNLKIDRTDGSVARARRRTLLKLITPSPAHWTPPPPEVD